MSPFTKQLRVSALPIRDVSSGSSSSHAQSSLNRFDHLRIHLCAGLQPAEFIVKNLPHQRRVTKDASGHGHTDWAAFVFRKQPIHHNHRHLRQLATRIGDDSRGYFILTGGHRRKERRKIRRRN
jgi:hypothetical protein